MDNTVRVWDASAGAEQRQFRAHDAGIWCMALSPDGKTLATGSYNETAIRLWNAARGTPLRRLEGHRAGLFRLVFSPDGKTLVSASNGHHPAQEAQTLRRWDVSTGAELPVPEQRRGDRGPLAFSPDGKYLATQRERLHIWEIATGRVVRQRDTPIHGNLAVAFSPDGRTVAFVDSIEFQGRSVGQLVLWELASDKDRLRTEQPPDWPGCLAFSPDGALLATGDRRGAVRLWDGATGESIGLGEAHDGRVESLIFTPDGRYLASGSADTTLLIWDVSVLLAKRPRGSALSTHDLDRLWEELGSSDAARAAASIARLTAAPAQAVPLLRARMRPISAPAARRMDRLLTDLDDSQFDVRERAAAELEKMGDLAEMALRRLQRGRPSPEVRRRVDGLIKKLEGPLSSAEELRTLRALEVLERLGTPEARTVLQTLAEGAPDARQTREARAALERLARGATTRP
jgi:hypothetical protein